MLSAIATVVLLATPPTGFTTAVERVALQRTGPKAEVKVNALLATLELTGAKPAGRLVSQLCPRTHTGPAGVIFSCTTRRLWATIAEDDQGVYLDVRALRGVTWRWEPDGLPLIAWPLKAIGIPDVCPGATDAGKAECALADGALFEAERLYTLALTGPDAHLARLRLGDLAMQRGDAEAALSWYARVNAAGVVGRMAQLRECDLTGNCFADGPTSLKGLSGPLELEARLHLIRRELALQHDRAAMEALVAQLELGPTICAAARALCQTMVEAAFTGDDEETTALALTAFVTGTLADGPRGLEVSLAAASAAEKAGAPAFAAAVLASVSARLPRAALDEHLQHVARLYLLAKDPVRAAFIVEYAAQKLPVTTTSSGSWRRLRDALSPPPPRRARTVAPPRPALAAQVAALTEDVELSKELARATAARTRAALPTPPAEPTP